jgi:hypothetical protein
MNYKLRMSGGQHAALFAHLFPGDGFEAVAVALCGRRVMDGEVTLLVHKVHPIPYGDCPIREPDRITWKTDRIQPLLAEAAKHNLALLKVHSHPGGYDRFSRFDDQSDLEFFQSVFGWIDLNLPHGSAVMLPDSRVFGRATLPGDKFVPFARVSVAGDDLSFWDYAEVRGDVTGEALLRNRQLFGEGTMRRLKNLAVAVVGYSGTGSIVVEQLARLGVGRLIVIEYDSIEQKNLNRILNATGEDADVGRLKVDVALRSVRAMGLGTDIETVDGNLIDSSVIRLVGGCDVLFGCVDSVEARHVMNRLATYYSLPYFDVGVRLDADGKGGIDQVCGSAHYLQPGGASLHSRGVYTMEEVRAEGLRRTDPVAYSGLMKDGYVRGIRVDRPAVITVNMLVSSLAVNDFLARLHPYRLDPNAEFATQTVSLTQGELIKTTEGDPCPMFASRVGRGDTRPLLDMPDLSEGRVER